MCDWQELVKFWVLSEGSLVRRSTCPRFQLSGLGLGQDLSEQLWGSEFFAVWMTLDDPNPTLTLTLGQVDPRTTAYEPHFDGDPDHRLYSITVALVEVCALRVLSLIYCGEMLKLLVKTGRFSLRYTRVLAF